MLIICCMWCFVTIIPGAQRDTQGQSFTMTSMDQTQSFIALEYILSTSTVPLWDRKREHFIEGQELQDYELLGHTLIYLIFWVVINWVL